MNIIDYIVVVLFLLGMIGIGYYSSKKVSNTSDLFTAKGKTSWWMSGISAYMTMFSAGTFVVWGGVAYRLGVVSIVISMCIGFGALIAGYLFAAKWNESGYTSAAEFVREKFGNNVVQMYTWLGMLTRIIAVAVALYSVAVIVSTLIPLSPDNFLANSEGTLSVTFMIIILGAVIVVYTFMGGLLAVLLTDFTQFIVLMISVLTIAPLIIHLGGGVSTIIEKLPSSHLSPFSGGYTFIFLVGWVIIHVFKVGGEWAFVQRHLCVDNPKDAKKAVYLFGGLYVLTPALWMLPPLVLSTINPNVNPEQAYIIAAKTVLPVGMIGLVVSSMLSATASMASSELNVFSGAITTEIYGNILKKGKLTDKELLNVGRIVTIFLGTLVVLIGISIPYLGGAEKVIVGVTSLFVGPMIMPTIWALYFKNVTKVHAYLTILISGISSALLKFVFVDYSFFSKHMKIMDVSFGILVPLFTLLLITAFSKQQDSRKIKE